MSLNIIVRILVLIVFFVLVIVLVKGNNSIVYIIDEFGNIYRKRGKVKGDKVSFKYNTQSKGGITIESNKLKQGKKNVFFFKEFDGLLLPINVKSIDKQKVGLNLSTAQEKLFETEALLNISKKIDNTWWNQIKTIAISAIIIFGAVVVSITMINKASDIEPVPEPQVMMWNNITTSMNQLVESNEKLIETISKEQTKKSNIPK